MTAREGGTSAPSNFYPVHGIGFYIPRQGGTISIAKHLRTFGTEMACVFFLLQVVLLPV